MKRSLQRCLSKHTDERQITHRCISETHSSISRSFLRPSPFQTLVFRHLRLGVYYRRPSSPSSWRVSACRVFVRYLQSSLLISFLLCAGFFLSSLVCCRHAFIFPQLFTIKSFIGRFCFKARAASLPAGIRDPVRLLISWGRDREVQIVDGW